MSEKILVAAKGIEIDEDGSLIGEIRADIDVDMRCFGLQLALFEDRKMKSDDRRKILNAFNEFYCSEFYDALHETRWNFIKKPKIFITGVTDDKIKINYPFIATQDVKAFSVVDGDITKDIKIDGKVDVSKLGENYLTYSVEDSEGNSIKVKRKITIRTNEKPKILGVENVTITMGDIFNPLENVKALDKEDGDITKYIEIKGKINNAKAGDYEILYTIIDSDDNIVTEKRIVTVKENTNEDEQLRLSIVNSARKLIGKPYVWGGNYYPLGRDSGTDCSGLCQWAYNDNGINISRTTYTQINEGKEAVVTALKPGDLIFSRFSSANTPEHVFLYSGYKNGQHWCVEAPRTGLNIRERQFDWGSNFRARRIIPDAPPVSSSSGNKDVGSKASANIIYYVKSIEGYAPYIYRDEVGVKTLGYGMTGGELEGVSTPLSESEATAHLTNNFNNYYYSKVLKMLQDKGATNMLQREVDALTSFAYNLGVEALRGSRLCAKYVAGERGESIHEEFKKWCHAGNQVLQGLVRRREEEWRIFSGQGNVQGYNSTPEISYIGTSGRETGELVTDNGGYGASPY